MVATILQKNESTQALEPLYSLEFIYDTYHKNVYNYIAYRINNHFDAEELAADVFVKALKNISRYNKEFPIEAWLITIAKNTVTDYLRKTKSRQFFPLDSILELVSSDKEPAEIALINEENKKLMEAMSKLRDKERQILSMKFATNLKHQQISEILKISVSQVGVIAHRAMEKLRRSMKEGEMA